MVAAYLDVQTRVVFIYSGHQNGAFSYASHASYLLHCRISQFSVASNRISDPAWAMSLSSWERCPKIRCLFRCLKVGLPYILPLRLGAGVEPLALKLCFYSCASKNFG